jgi:catechol 2,3-dioxygenase-like lactoylglutathione lyase family enzyme
MQGQGLHHVAIRVRSLDVSLRFYGEGFGFSCLARWEEDGAPVAFITNDDGACLELFEPSVPDNAAPGPLAHLALAVEDCDGAYARALAAGAQPAQPPLWVTITGGPRPLAARIAFCIGPSGERIELLQSRDM